VAIVVLMLVSLEHLWTVNKEVQERGKKKRK